ncbi:MAG: hypothetical protein IPJ34_33955 [Myxococcales bacterium]|nr:hypothetical protein [Myxococcales bacterium]
MLLPSLLVGALVTPDPTAWTRPVSVDVHFGSSTAPFGALGLSATYTPHPAVGFELGAGYQYGTNDGLQAAGLVHAQVGDERVHFGIAAGVSRGRYRDDPNCQTGGAFVVPGGCAAVYTGPALRLDAAWAARGQLEIDVRTLAGFHARLAAGVGHVLNADGEFRCEAQPGWPNDCTREKKRTRPYFDLALGWAF